MTLFRSALGALALAAALPALAQDYRFGVQAHVSAPQGDLKDTVDNKAGLGGGVHLSIDFGQGHAVRPRVDFTAFPNATAFGVDNKVSNLSFGADYLYMLEGRGGFYLTGGLSANRWKVESDVPGRGAVSDTATRLGYAVGGGYAFNENFSAELRYTATKFDRRGLSDQNANAVQLAALYRF
jgi:hypothetical protein